MPSMIDLLNNVVFFIVSEMGPVLPQLFRWGSNNKLVANRGYTEVAIVSTRNRKCFTRKLSVAANHLMSPGELFSLQWNSFIKFIVLYWIGKENSRLMCIDCFSRFLISQTKMLGPITRFSPNRKRSNVKIVLQRIKTFKQIFSKIKNLLNCA